MLNLKDLLTGRARHMSYVTRFAGVPVARAENVAEHSFITAQYAFMIARYCEASGSRHVDLAKLLVRALVHDMDEAVMVDLPRPIKYADEELRQRWQVLCCRAIQEMETTLGVPFFREWLDAKDDSLEGQILKLADLLSVTSYIIEELRRGNTFMRPVLEGNMGYLSAYAQQLRLPTALLDLTLQASRVAAEYLT